MNQRPAGLVTWEPSDADGRRKLVVLTKKGRQLRVTQVCIRHKRHNPEKPSVGHRE